jgi:hypothetical protein
MKQGQSKAKPALDDVLEKGKKILDYLNDRNFQEVPYENPFTLKANEDEVNSIDRINLLEYSLMENVNKKVEKNEISDFEESIHYNNPMCIKDFSNLIFKIEDFVLQNDKILNKKDLLYIECKVPLFLANGKLIYDTFKYFIF